MVGPPWKEAESCDVASPATEWSSTASPPTFVTPEGVAGESAVWSSPPGAKDRACCVDDGALPVQPDTTTLANSAPAAASRTIGSPMAPP